eukprot:g20982.t1
MAENRIFIRLLTGRSIECWIDISETVSTLKDKIYDKEGVPPENQRIIFAGKELENDRTLESYNVRSEANLHLILRPTPPGGWPQQTNKPSEDNGDAYSRQHNIEHRTEAVRGPQSEPAAALTHTTGMLPHPREEPDPYWLKEIGR